MIGWLELILTRRVGKGASDSGIIKSVEQKGTLVIIGNTPGYLADACQLVADARVRKLRSANTRCKSDAQKFWRQDLCRRRTISLEQPNHYLITT